MMRKSLVAMCMAIVFSFCFGLSAYAQAPQETLVSQYTEYYADGSYAVVTVYENTNARAMWTSGEKSYNYYDGGLAWTLTVYGSFSYNNSSATCTGASYGISISNSAWSCESGSSGTDGATANASATMVKDNGRRVNASVSLSCDGNGNLS